MGLAILIAGLVVFIATHVFVTRREARAALIARIGLVPYRALFSLVAIVGLALIVWGFGRYLQTGYIQVWTPPAGMRHVTEMLVLIAVILMVAAYIRGHIYRKLKHPFLAGVKLWALAHLLSNGDLGGIILFGAILAWAVFDRISLKRRTDAGAPAIASGGVGYDVAAVVVGVLIYLALGFYFHPRFIGVPVFGPPPI
jgi:uncharacterized membrane protein